MLAFAYERLALSLDDLVVRQHETRYPTFLKYIVNLVEDAGASSQLGNEILCSGHHSPRLCGPASSMSLYILPECFFYKHNHRGLDE